ncbi:MAG: hypothetical protein WB873_05105 [Thermoplasmata archaeon]
MVDRFGQLSLLGPEFVEFLPELTELNLPSFLFLRYRHLTLPLARPALGT